MSVLPPTVLVRDTQVLTATTVADHPLLAEMLPHGPIKIESQSVLQTSRLVLRPLRASDHDAWVELVRSSRSNLDAFAPLHEPGESDSALFERQLALTQAGEASGKAWRRIAVLADGRILGGFNINSIRRGLYSDGDVNWWLGEVHQGCGFASEAVGALVDYAFLDMPWGIGLHRLNASIKPGHERSIRLARRIGFELSGERLDRMRCAGGQWATHDQYKITPACSEASPA